MRRWSWILLAVWAGCTRFVDAPPPGTCTPACPDDAVCVDGACVPLAPDAEDAADVADLVVIPDLPPETADDEGPDRPGPGDAEEDAADAAHDAAEAQEPLAGRRCATDAECGSGQSCIPLSIEGDPDHRVCTGPCGPGCPDGTWCAAVAREGDAFVERCVPFTLGLCARCRTKADCARPDARCEEMPGGTFCTHPCDDQGGCAPGFTCQPAGPGPRCVPVAGTCACTAELADATFQCETRDAEGRCLGTLACTVGAGWSCDARLPETEACNGADDNCDGRTDENFVLVDWDGRVLSLREPCGTGPCADGIVTCAAPSRAGCSTDPLRAAQEACGAGWGDGVDDDCDGVVDGGCSSVDLDGDGDPNATDCAPTDPARRHAGPGAEVPEPCCPAATAFPDRVARCDFDCDGQVSLCAAGDADSDGHVAVGQIGPDGQPGDDCDDGNPARHPDAPDRCDDGLDQDCDGTDLHCCLPGVEGCSGPLDADADGYVGRYDCNDGDPSQRPDAPESCDGKDQDCDGVADDDDPGGLEPVSGVQVGGGTPCGPSTGECDPGRWTCAHYPGGVARMECVGARDAVDERCNGLDDDCDGQTDEDFPELGLACDGDDADRCERGIATCASDGFGVACVEAFGQADLLEECGNNRDDDCDGAVDNGCLPKDRDGDGSVPPLDCDESRTDFRPGAPEGCCDPTLMLADALKHCDHNCDGKVARCNVHDRDFDGYVDTAFSYPDNRPGDDCDDADARIHPGAPDKCADGKDQDCDGADLACCAPNDPGCTGPVDADGDGWAPPGDCNDTNPYVNPGEVETCNGRDDDCDGLLDDGNPGTSTLPCGSDEGECQAGLEVCARVGGAAQVVCVPARGPAVEACNARDDNCNGRTDEVFPDLGRACDGPDDDRCANGVLVCLADGTGVECAPELRVNLRETCNGLDDDCDGATDEDFRYDGLAVGAVCEGRGECGPGFVVCSGNGTAATCSTNPDGNAGQAGPELCDGLDNDCDGLADGGVTWNGWPLGGPCRGIGACGVGYVECNRTTLQATCTTNPDGTFPGMRPEVCNGLDDDCNGHTDEGLTPSALDCKRRGVCSGYGIPARCLYGYWNCDYSGVPGYEGDQETSCDGVDNDCDGATDEGFPVGQACDGPDLDQCANGVFTCRPDRQGVECKSEVVTDIPELCNRKDDDCDGRADEDFPVGEFCDGPDSDFCRNGSFTCKADGSGTECRNEVAVDLQESCNAQDDNCDGVTDEGFAWEGLPVGTLCDGTGACGEGTVACHGGRPVCTTNPDGPASQATPELCNGQDDDCNGVTDEGFAYNGGALGAWCVGTGACGTGTVVCNVLGNAATCSSNPDAPGSAYGQEICDGIDNNCNGLTDENQAWKTLALGAPCTAPGVCGAGTVVCAPATNVATCSTLPDGTTPKGGPETCNTLDDDCNGLVDDFPAGVPSGDPAGCTIGGVCRADLVDARCTNGAWVCDYSRVPNREVPEERTCDGLDNDCDGTVDDPWSIGLACDGPDADLCANGARVCNPAGDGWTCGVESPAEIAEACNGRDDDCDGATDEEGAAGCVAYWPDQDGDGYGVGAETHCLCVPGAAPYPLFRAQVAGDCDDAQPAVHPATPEKCNAVDDDCNGQTDDGAAFANKGRPCQAAPAPAGCMNGRWACSADGAALECVGAHLGPETCNALDDDCNGQTDETFHVNLASGASCQDAPGIPCTGMPKVGEACKGLGECGWGTVVCVASTTAACSTNPNGPASQAQPEKCNARDDDCNGVADNGFALGSACDGGDEDSCKQGTYSCAPDQLSVQCVNEPSPPNPSTTELCDNKDNDCDGTTDEPWPEKGQKCDLKPSAPVPCATGLRFCAAGGTSTTCTGWTECVPGDTCQDSGATTLADACLCGSKACTKSIASQCVAGSCQCGTGAACVGKTCRSNDPTDPNPAPDSAKWTCQ